ncbi:MAG TPA: YiiX/YebB-like N1pC/P60 family cysteine hydrolase, partial [Gemmatimonadales bacterium]|nr:YiiX/YebB-like N1pC/P60 family cysteine hydrolase [Gemmatimonadales bacterium]
DILVSRGGYPTSALIARGSDHPGNFSHVALVHVDSATHEISVIEAHIESGVKIATAERYLADKKLRLMALRPRHDLPALQADPALPHRAASELMERARKGHIPYDFAMNYRDPGELFCSEVASSAYHGQGVALWMKLSAISAPGLRRWLASFGVRHFETQEPSDLEYDPQLVVVAEWSDPGTLRKDHIDNAVTDVMLEQAELGADLDPRWWDWPLARVAKGYSWVLNRFGQVGPIPEGMSAGGALRSRVYTQRHAALAGRVDSAAVAWEKQNGYPPPYWRLVEIARGEIRDLRSEIGVR